MADIVIGVNDLATLIHDMTETQVADMYARIVVYGLFSARCMNKSQDDFSAIEQSNDG